MKAGFWDHEGFRQTTDVVSGVIVKFLVGPDPRTGKQREFGFARMENGNSIFFHRNNGHFVDAHEHEDKTWLPSFNRTLHPDETFAEPQVGNRIVGVVGQDSKGRLALIRWTYASLFEKARCKCQVLMGEPKEPMPFDEAARLLASSDFDCLKDCAFGDEEFGWHLGEVEIARGYGKYPACDVWVNETEFYAATTFSDEQARRLYDTGGRTESFTRNDAGDPREW